MGPNLPMSVRISSYPTATPAHRQLARISVDLGKSMRRLSSGLRIATAADDASGLAMSERLRARIRSLDQANRNTSDGLSMMRVADGALGTVADLLIRMRELAIHANNGTVSATDRKTLNNEYQSLANEIERITESTEYNGIGLLDGSQQSIDLQIGTGTQAGIDTLTVDVSRSLMVTLALGNSRINTPKNAVKAVKRLDRALDRLNTKRGSLGSVQSRLASTIRNLSNQFESASAAESRIRDVDIAKETAELTRTKILQATSVAVLAQMHAQPAALLPLLLPGAATGIR